MNWFVAIIVAAFAFAPSGARAQERAGDAALGALSGAVVLGPIGAVAGAVVGFTAGPSIAHAWGLNRTRPSRPARLPRRAAPKAPPQRVSTRNATAPRTIGQAAQASMAPPARPAARPRVAMPPVQGFE